MSLHTALASIELEYLSDLVRDNAAVVKDLDHISTLQEDGIGGAFEKSLRVKGMIDELEVTAQRQPSWKTLAALLRSEYKLWSMNEQTPLRHNPFLSHWVDAIQRLEVAAQVKGERVGDEGVSAQDIAAARLEMIKRLLLPHMDAQSATPQNIYDARHPGTPFDVRPYIVMLQEEGVLDPTPGDFDPPSSSTTSQPQDTSVKPEPGANTKTSPSPSTSPSRSDSPRPTFPEWRAFILASLGTQPSLAAAQLTRLPIALPALDFLTELITSGALSTHAINAKETVLSFVQHALRVIEHMGQPAPTFPSSSHPPPPAQTDIGLGIGTMDDAHGRDAQARALRLLVLFLRNLLKKGHVDVDPGQPYTLYWDLEGMYRSYMWMREVREFKRMIEEGDIKGEEAGSRVVGRG
ncbi:hypothetical protein E8E13_011475 [Curvularia kusanoi]|uniref:CCR4-NOT transcription complex subunit 11 n=1 Tax=Curvularia kusanoi TaxID=90978 RepID=A0A9P4TP81_CURKU|nr:hypothetical protein E8E13_011475 [Curvularia kusanoi]